MARGVWGGSRPQSGPNRSRLNSGGVSHRVSSANEPTVQTYLTHVFNRVDCIVHGVDRTTAHSAKDNIGTVRRHVRIGTGSKVAATIHSRLEMGARVAAWARDHPEDVKTRWRRMAREHFNLQPTGATVSRMRRCYKEWCVHTADGVHSHFAAGVVSGRARRLMSDASGLLRKAPCISFELLQWFVDYVVGWRCRADARLVMDQARWYRQQLFEAGVADKDLPKITKNWIFRWRC